MRTRLLPGLSLVILVASLWTPAFAAEEVRNLYEAEIDVPDKDPQVRK
ncbi:MAG: hypothetical protein GWO02_14380, partial [Gammaproteobacteria bacterium]|nr:hypothetical protein [Gammaproteobacteria bacterium]